MSWNFSILLEKPVTPEQSDAFDHCDAFADGEISYTLAMEEGATPLPPASPDMFRELTCMVEAPSYLDAVAQALQRIRLIDGFRPVGVTLSTLVDLEEAAQRSGLDEEEMVRLSKDSRFPEPKTRTGTVFYAWDSILAFFQEIGAPVPDVPREVLIADLALRLADALDGADIPPGSLKALGLSLD
ncbi:hypothetical protein [Streptomyces sp. NPDC049881]|uniref:hypothetical protein n=1 Tax=Streptomyces sp. NPDC049881 TaxID=3155778 RepID=UPI003413C943